MSSVKRQHSEALSDSIANDQTSIAVAFDIKRKHSSHTGGTATNPFDVFGDSKGGVESSNATRLTSAIAEFVYCKGLSFSSVEGDHFYQILKLFCLVSPAYRPPGRKLLLNNLLDLSYENRMNRYLDSLSKEANMYGLLLFGDCGTVHGMPVMNILATGVHEPSAVLAIVDCKLFCFFEFAIEFVTRPFSILLSFPHFERYKPSRSRKEEGCNLHCLIA
jgi:hypothetical protein